MKPYKSDRMTLAKTMKGRLRETLVVYLYANAVATLMNNSGNDEKRLAMDRKDLDIIKFEGEFNVDYLIKKLLVAMCEPTKAVHKAIEDYIDFSEKRSRPIVPDRLMSIIVNTILDEQKPYHPDGIPVEETGSPTPDIDDRVIKKFTSQGMITPEIVHRIENPDGVMIVCVRDGRGDHDWAAMP